jgi:glycosyltransferase involved in cell wall biosynthesis
VQSRRALGRLRPRAAQPVTPPPRVHDYARELRTRRGVALLCYLVEPFRREAEASRRHSYSNWMMAIEVGNALNRLGYLVDVVNYDDYRFEPTRPYDVFVGMTANFPRLRRLMSASTRTIYWATRADPAFEMEARRQRQAALYQRRGTWLPTPSVVETLVESPQYKHADGLLLVGNRWTRSTFQMPGKPVHCIDNPALPAADVTRTQSHLHDNRRHFLFLSSWLLVSKGLDLVLEAFAARPHLHLWICGPVDAEPDFARVYRQELFHRPNIRSLGWMDVHSVPFRDLAARCGFVVFPSAVEGMSGSVLTGMSHGLVPLCTQEAGVDLDDFGIVIDGGDPASVGRAVDTASAMSAAEWSRRSEAARHEVRERYTIERFRDRIESTLQDCLTARGASA